MKFLSNLIYSIGFYFCILFSKEKMFNPKARKKIKSSTTVEHKLDYSKMHLKEGDQYRLGTSTVTLAKFGIEGKKEVAAKLEALRMKRELKEAKLKEKAVDIMLLPKEELYVYRINDWLTQREEFQKKLLEFENLSDEPPANPMNERST